MNVTSRMEAQVSGPSHVSKAFADLLKVETGSAVRFFDLVGRICLECLDTASYTLAGCHNRYV
jgi:hypothetical protein